MQGSDNLIQLCNIHRCREVISYESWLPFPFRVSIFSEISMLDERRHGPSGQGTNEDLTSSHCCYETVLYTFITAMITWGCSKFLSLVLGLLLLSLCNTTDTFKGAAFSLHTANQAIVYIILKTRGRRLKYFLHLWFLNFPKPEWLHLENLRDNSGAPRKWMQSCARTTSKLFLQQRV